MSYDSMPSYEQAPSFDDVVAYALEEKLFGAISLVKFYDYYGDFKNRGVVIDWKTKMHEWAKRQRTPVVVCAKEYDAMQRVKAKEARWGIDANKVKHLEELWAKVAMI